MPRDNLPEQEPPPVKKPGFLDRMFDGKSDGRFVKRLLIVMLLIATAVQPISLIYTAYSGHGEFDPAKWWEYAPALAVLLFVALDWTIMPLAYFFATTNKPGLKLMLAIMLIVVTGGAFDGYFTATERLIAMRLEEITRYRLAVDGCHRRRCHGGEGAGRSARAAARGKRRLGPAASRPEREGRDDRQADRRHHRQPGSGQGHTQGKQRAHRVDVQSGVLRVHGTEDVRGNGPPSRRPEGLCQGPGTAAGGEGPAQLRHRGEEGRQDQHYGCQCRGEGRRSRQEKSAGRLRRRGAEQPGVPLGRRSARQERRAKSPRTKRTAC